MTNEIDCFISVLMIYTNYEIDWDIRDRLKIRINHIGLSNGD